jgi:hypothetical protein
MSSTATATRPATKLEIRYDITRGKLNFRLFKLTVMLACLVIAAGSLVAWHFPDDLWALIFVGALFAWNISKLQLDGPERIAVYGAVFGVLLFAAAAVDHGLSPRSSIIGPLPLGG